MRHAISCAVLVIAGYAGGPAAAQPLVSNGRVETHELRGGLAATIESLADRAPGPMWIAWQEAAASRLDSCCWQNDCRGCRLEPVPEGTVAAPMQAGGRQAPVALEGDMTLVVLVRIEARQVDRIRMVGATCPLDAGGLPFTTLSGVPAADSIAWLRTLVDAPGAARPRRLTDGALHTIANHADPSAVPVLLEVARGHAESNVRGGALVALSLVAGRRIAPELRDAIDRDPDTEVKKRAVFALSRLPKDESVPLLIQVAREHRNVAVRRQAMFWLGQSSDPRAIDFFAAVLK